MVGNIAGERYVHDPHLVGNDFVVGYKLPWYSTMQ